MKREPNPYTAEAELVAALLRVLCRSRGPWGRTSTAVEFDYVSGRTDVIAFSKGRSQLIAFEAKLSKWRDALHQAYRNRCFADRSYVVLPERSAFQAAQYPTEFRRRRVGLCYLTASGAVKILLDVESAPPLQPWLSAKAIEAVRLTEMSKRTCQIRTTSNLRNGSAPLVV